MNALPLPKSIRMTVGEFLDWPGDGTETQWELVAGELRAQAMPSAEHSEIQGNILSLLTDALRGRQPCRALPEAGLYRTKRHHTYRGADIVVTCKDRRHRGEPIEPRIVIEIPSPSNRAETLAKLDFYAAFDGVEEIVTVDSERIEVVVYRRGGEDWADMPAEVLGAGDRLALRSLDVTPDLADIYRNVPF